MKKISIDPVTRLEGHGRIEIFLNDEGEVANAYFIVPELRGFEQFCVGRLAEDMPNITSRICGICPEAHHIASTKALDDLYRVDPPPAAKKLREMFYSAFFVADHTTHFYALGGPDFIVGPDAPPAERNIFGVLQKIGIDIGREVIECRKRNHHAIQLVGGRVIHPCAGLPGGWSKALTGEEQREIQLIAEKNIAFALRSLDLFRSVVLQNPEYHDLMVSDAYTHRTYYMGTVDERGYINFYDGRVRVVDPDGNELVNYHPRDYRDHITERVESWTYLKFPYLKAVGWKGFVDGAQSGVYCATPLARLNVAKGMATPRAQEAFEQFYATLGTKRDDGSYGPVHYRLATHWARLIELLYAAERMHELIVDPEITDPHVRVIPTETPVEGVGAVEAPRGTLTHHYRTDERGILQKVNLVVGTTNNYAPIAMSVKKAAQTLISKGTIIEQGLLNRIEMAFRLYDPCFSCATHALPGQMPLRVRIRNQAGEVIRELSQY
ncbi:MAG: Ni/Fe hydrogenase subunit alpha [Nitrospirota bacterium]